MNRKRSLPPGNGNADAPNVARANASRRAKAVSAAQPAQALEAYRSKRDFTRTLEPSGDEAYSSSAAADRPAPLRFVVQKHWARRLHYDFRLEIEGTLKSWAVPKGPSLDPTVRRMAVEVEDHPLSYGSFEGTIPKGEYGAGKVLIWDAGHWTPDGDPDQAYRAGKLKFQLKGSKLHGRWMLVRTGSRSQAPDSARAADGNAAGQKQPAWLLIKEKDSHACSQAQYDITEALPERVGDSAAATADQMPETLSPQLATRVSAPPTTPGWAYELKYDGYRILSRVEAGQARFHTRSGHDWTQRLPALARVFEAQGLPDGWYDGEIVVLDEQGRPDFHALQNAFEPEGGWQTPRGPGRRGKNRKDDAHSAALVYFLFDLPWLGHEDLRQHPLAERQARLAELLANVTHPSLRLSGVFTASAQDMLDSACALGLEGVIGKRLASPYVPGRSGHWIKLKCGERQEFVVGGYTDPQGSRSGLGALLLGYYDEDGALRYAGKVGSGFSDAALQSLHRRLVKLRQDQPAFIDPPQGAGLHWVRPKLAAEVSFSQWTASGRIRHAVFLGLREDKPPSLMTKEHTQSISNAGRLVDARSGTRKGDIATYYERIATLMLPHLKDRPVSLLRAPDGLTGELFFQKHMSADRLTGLMELDPALDPGHDPLVVVRNSAGLTQAAQLNVIEFHTWNAVRSRIDRPDRISFDLDPGKGVEWQAMQEAAVLLHNFLQELELPAFLKTSGGKGLHVIVPIIRRYDWDTAKGFSRAVVQHMAEVLPRRFSAKSGPRNRVGKIFIDYLRNGFGATTVAAWSLRARPGIGISVPTGWDEVETLQGGDHWTILNVEERLAIGNQPWKEYEQSAAALGPAMKRLGYRSQA